MSNRIEEIDWDAAELFRDEMEEYLEKFEIHLNKLFSKGTVSKYTVLVSFYIDELYGRYGVSGFEQITLGMSGSNLVRSYNSHCCENLQLRTYKNILATFFSFIFENYGIALPELIRKLKK